MAAVTFATLIALNRMPVGSETAASCVRGFKRWTTVNDPMKTEYNWFQVTNGDDFTDDDTFQSGLAHPHAATVVWCNVDAVAVGEPSALLEGVESDADFRRVTVQDADGVNAAGIMVIVYGY
jgi:hypothetical protein